MWPTSTAPSRSQLATAGLDYLAGTGAARRARRPPPGPAKAHLCL